MSTIFNPYKIHTWFYQGSIPTKLEYEIALDYLHSKLPQKIPQKNIL